MRTGTAVVGAVLGVTLGLASCGGGSSHSSSKDQTPPASTSVTAAPTTTLSVAALADKYLAIIKPANDAGCVADAKTKALPSTVDASKYQPIVAPVVAAYNLADQQLTQVDWPANVKPDVTALVQADSALSGDLGALPQQTSISYPQWETQEQADANKEVSAANVVRHDLGLPPVVTGCP